MQIASLSIKNPFILAPLAGFTDLAFRLLCKEYGAGLVYSEMISCHGLVFKQQNTIEMLDTCADERPVAMQLFGAEAKIMGEAAAILSDYPIDIIDINMGCPVKKVIKKGSGSALMKTPQLAAEIIKAVVKNSSVPVTVKIRTGWNHQQIIAADFAKMAEDCGAAAVAVHARTWSDGFSGLVDWPVIKEVKKAVNIPVIGNGDVLCYDDGIKMMAETGCDGVMIGRAALGAPWIFSSTINPQPSINLRLRALHRHLQLIEQYITDRSVLARSKNQAARYFKGIPGGSAMRQNIYATKAFSELKNLIASFAETSAP